MNCENCGSPMHWEGSLRSGSMVCPFCNDVPDGDEVTVTRPNLIDAYKHMAATLGATPVKPSNVNPGVPVAARDDITCVQCGHQDSILSGVNLDNITCPSCNTLGSFVLDDGAVPVPTPATTPSAIVEIWCGNCGETGIAYKGINLSVLVCPGCLKTGFVQEL